MKFKLFIDMDGVFVDFIGGALKFFKSTRTVSDWPKGHWGSSSIFLEMFGLPLNDFWNGLREDFWRGLDYTKDGIKFLELVEPFKPCILTSPAWHSATGKQDWIQEKLPHYFKEKRYLIGPAKHYCAAPMHVLIDDSDKNVREFRAAGGTAILYPRPWNELHWIEDPLDYVQSMVEVLTWHGPSVSM